MEFSLLCAKNKGQKLIKKKTQPNPPNPWCPPPPGDGDGGDGDGAGADAGAGGMTSHHIAIYKYQLRK